MSARIDHDQIVDAPFVKNLQCLSSQSVLSNADGISSHDLAKALVQEIAVVRHMTAKIAVGKNADQFATFVNNTKAATLCPCHDQQGFFNPQALIRHCIA